VTVAVHSKSLRYSSSPRFLQRFGIRFVCCSFGFELSGREQSLFAYAMHPLETHPRDRIPNIHWKYGVKINREGPQRERIDLVIADGGCGGPCRTGGLYPPQSTTFYTDLPPSLRVALVQRVFGSIMRFTKPPPGDISPSIHSMLNITSHDDISPTTSTLHLFWRAVLY